MVMMAKCTVVAAVGGETKAKTQEHIHQWKPIADKIVVCALCNGYQVDAINNDQLYRCCVLFPFH